MSWTMRIMNRMRRSVFLLNLPRFNRWRSPYKHLVTNFIFAPGGIICWCQHLCILQTIVTIDIHISSGISSDFHRTMLSPARMRPCIASPRLAFASHFGS